MNGDQQHPGHMPPQQRPYYGGPEGPAPRHPGGGGGGGGGGHGGYHPMRALPMHLQRPPFEQPYSTHPKAPNPIDDLVDTEKEYVADLKVLLQRVSAGWTQDDFPPKEVDILLRNVEEIYAVNRKFSKRLAEVQSYEDPTKALNDILMWFVDTMETPYSNFCRNHVPHFDNWPEIIHNIRLQDILTTIAGEQFQHVTLDSFLLKPIERLQYYRRVYMRLLESSERGNPDHDALEAAFMKLDTILRYVTIDVPGTSRHPASPALSGISSMSMGALRNALPSPPPKEQQGSQNFPPQGRPTNQPSPSLPPSPMSPDQRPQQPPPRTSEAMQELERTLDTSRVLDLFTMQPKACTLSLTLIERSVIIRGDLGFGVNTDEGIEERFDDGHVILLSDLLLICRVKTQEEIDMNPEGNESTFWLLFPPLAIRHVQAKDGTIEDDDPILELTIVNRVTVQIWTRDEQLKMDWIDEVAGAQQKDAAKIAQQQQQQQQGQHLNRNFTQSRPMRPMGSPMSPTFQDQRGPASPPFPGFHGGPMGPPRPNMGGPMNGMPSPGFRPMPSLGSQMRPPRPPADHRMSMRRTNNMMIRPGPPGPPGPPRPRPGDASAVREIMFKTRPCDVFQWRDENWEPLIEEDDCFADLRVTTANRMAMAVTTSESAQLLLNAWIVESTTFRRASETDVSVSMDMGASVQWFLVALDTPREADEFCMAFQRAKERAMYDPSLQKTVTPVLSRGDSLASTGAQQPRPQAPVRQTLTPMHPPCECKLLLQAGDHGQWMSLGTARVEIRKENPSGYVRLFVGLISGQKRVLDSVIVQRDCLELVGPKKLAITLQNPQEKMSIIYMLQFKDEAMATKIFEGLSLNENE
ncbi:hypothetical protein B0O80DRAFT_422049 [Mortierella sp. GBAus27b]|nr:hypothetical protein BGX31_007872 [Mortierella sp. GBA43]KAI8362560.1 hypothetical protein B0O80DRAFT_422049 [Mortierella sp. GBAus27b]